MKNSYKFFENRDCKYYPCHNDVTHINCLFCYCPLYGMKCPGTYSYIVKNNKQIKVCTECTYPHIPENYEMIIKLLSNDNGV